MAQHNEIGKLGEQLAAKYLLNKGFLILCQNYYRKWGEIDIVTQKDGVIRFIEVKTVSRKSYGGKFEQEINNYRPEDNVHPFKIKRISRAIQTYLLEKFKKSDIPWQFDLICVFLDYEKKVAKVRYIENLVL